jgi:hypothetical protein
MKPPPGLVMDPAATVDNVQVWRKIRDGEGQGQGKGEGEGRTHNTMHPPRIPLIPLILRTTQTTQTTHTTQTMHATHAQCAHCAHYASPYHSITRSYAHCVPDPLLWTSHLASHTRHAHTHTTIGPRITQRDARGYKLV